MVTVLDSAVVKAEHLRFGDRREFRPSATTLGSVASSWQPYQTEPVSKWDESLSQL